MICPKCGNHVIKVRIEDTPEGTYFSCCGYFQADSRPDIEVKVPLDPANYPAYMEPITCECGAVEIPTSSSQKRCKVCAAEAKKRRWRAKQPHVAANCQGRSC
jgi:hypothetical protein